MWILPIGFFIQVCVLVSLVCVIVPRNAQEPVEVCKPWREDAAERCIIFIGDEFEPDLHKARAKVTFKPNMFQWDGLFSIFAGTPGHTVYNQYYPVIDSLISRVDNVVYFGPESIADEFSNIRKLLAFTYPDERIRKHGSLRANDAFVIEQFHHLMSASHANKTFKNAISGKTIFIIYLTSGMFSNKKFRKESEEVYKARKDVSRFVSRVERTMREEFSDGRTVFVEVPDWKFNSPMNAEIQVWGFGVSTDYKEPIQLEDICPLIASLIGVSEPLGSRGKLPESFLNVPKRVRLNAITCNALQLHQVAFPEGENRCNVDLLRKILNESSQNCENISQLVRAISLEKLQSIRNSYDTITFALVCSTLIGWTAVIFTEIMVISEGELMPSSKIRILLLLIFVLIIACTNSVILYTSNRDAYRYVLFYHLAMGPWFVVVMRFKVIWNWFCRKPRITSFFYLPVVLVLAEVMFWIFKGGFLLALGISMVSLYPLFPQFYSSPYLYTLLWYITSIFLIIFSFVLSPVLIEEAPLHLSNISGSILMFVGGAALLFFKGKRNVLVGVLLELYLVISTFLSAFVIIFEQVKPVGYITSWCLLSSIFLPFFGKRNFLDRFSHMLLAFSTPLILTTRKLEPLSFVIVNLFVFLWMFLERSFNEKFTGQWHYLRRGFLLYFSCAMGYLLMGKLGYFNFYDKAIYQAFASAFEGHTVFLLMFLKYILPPTSILMTYFSLVKFKWDSDVSFLYAYLIGELVCLRYLCKMFFFGGDATEEIFNHIFINIFTIFLLLSYFFGSFYAAPAMKDKKLTEVVSHPE